MRNKMLPKVLLLLGFAVLILVVLYQGQIKDFWGLTIEKLSVYYDNFISPTGEVKERKRPVSLIKKQTELELYVGEPFRSFESDEEWVEFWGIIYGGFPGEAAGPDLPLRMRQMSKDEIKSALTERYQQSFLRFDDNAWDRFFELLFAK